MKITKPRSLNHRGFTLVEILMVVLLISILAAIGITQFKDFTTETKNSALKANLQVMRNGISQQYGQQRLRCGTTGSAWPPLANLTANDITSGASPCTTTQVPAAGDRPFVSGTSFPVNPWGPGPTNTIVACTTTGCTSISTLNCTAGARSNSDDGWCYNTSSGKIWANSARNDGTNGTTGTEYNY